MKRLCNLLSALLLLGASAICTNAQNTPLPNVKMRGAGNEVVSGATLTIKSGATFTLEGGGTVTGMQATDATLTALAGQTTAANKLTYWDGVDDANTIDFSPVSQTLLGYTTIAEWRNAIFPTTAAEGDLITYDGTNWIRKAIGTAGQIPVVQGDGTWDWQSSVFAPGTATYITQTPDSGLDSEQALSTLGTGLLKNTTGTGVLSIAASGTDYVLPGAATTSALTMATSRILGRTTASSGAIEELTTSAVLDMISSTQGSVLYRGASGWAALTPGTSGDVLTSQGAGADPIYSSGGGGGAFTSLTDVPSSYTGQGGKVVAVKASADGLEFISGGGGNTALFVGRVAKTAAYTAVAGDKAYLIDCTSGTFSISLTAAATLTDGWFIAVYNSGSGTITLDPNGSETIRDQFSSATTKTLAQGEGVVLFCNGSGFYVVSSSRGYGTSVTFAAAGSVVANTTLDLQAGGGNNISLNTTGAGVVTTASVVNITNSTASTGYNSGALVLNNGGLGVRGAIYRRTPGAVNVNMSGTTVSNITAVGNVGTGEDTLMSYSVPGNTLFANGDRVRIHATFTFAANANNKTLKAKFGATTFYDSTALAINGGSAVLDAVITRTGAATQNVSVAVISGNATLPHAANVTTAAETLGSAVTLSFTGEATSNDDISQRELLIEYMPAP